MKTNKLMATYISAPSSCQMITEVEAGNHIEFCLINEICFMEDSFPICFIENPKVQIFKIPNQQDAVMSLKIF